MKTESHSHSESISGPQAGQKEDLIDALEMLRRHAMQMNLFLTAHLIGVAAECIRCDGDVEGRASNKGPR